MHRLFRTACLTVLFAAAAVLASAQVQFHQGDWNSLLAAAKAQNKPFYVDFYTDWCGPCKLMTRNTFGNKEVGAFSNSNYIAYKLNAEEGEGVQLAAKYRIEGYPTVILFTPDGKVKEVLLGYHDAPTFLEVLRKHAGKQRLGDANGSEPKPMRRATAAEKASLGVLFQQP